MRKRKTLSVTGEPQAVLGRSFCREQRLESLEGRAWVRDKKDCCVEAGSCLCSLTGFARLLMVPVTAAAHLHHSGSAHLPFPAATGWGGGAQSSLPLQPSRGSDWG